MVDETAARSAAMTAGEWAVLKVVWKVALWADSSVGELVVPSVGARAVPLADSWVVSKADP